MIIGLLSDLPELTNERSLFSVPLVHLFHDPAGVIEKVFGTFDEQEYIDAGLFCKFRRLFYENLCAASGLVSDQEHRKPYTWPSKQKLSPTELTDTYLAGTPFHKLFHVQVPLAVTNEAMFSHMHVVGGSGAGKTQWLSQLILHHLDDPDRPAVVVVDSQGDLISKLSRLEALDRRAVLVTPKDIKHPPAINVFDMKQGRLDRYDEVTREQVAAGAIQTFDYLFSGLLGADLTFKQRTFFVYVCRLLLTLPDTMGRNATILDMIDLMDDPTPYREAIERPPAIQRRFFERDFHQKNFQQTKEQIRYRLSGILENPTLERLFTAPELNAWLLDQCIAHAKAHRHPEFREWTIWEAFEAERPSLVPYAGRFDGFHAVPASVSKTCLVRFDNNTYSVARLRDGSADALHANPQRAPFCTPIQGPVSTPIDRLLCARS